MVSGPEDARRKVTGMRMRTLGGTGIKVSPYCLGAMMFGAWGNPDHEESIRIIHAALDGGINFIDTADVYSAGESEEIVGKALLRPPRRRGAGHQGAQPDGRGRQHARQLAPLDRPRGREQPAPPADRLHRPVPDAPSRPGHRHRRDPVRPVRPGAQRQGPRDRLLHVPGRAASSRRSGSRRPAAASGSAASSRPTRSSSAASRRRCCRPARSTAWASSPGARWRAAG